jgi:hypothetical protein
MSTILSGLGIGLSAIRRITDLWQAGKSDSLIDYTAVSRVEPIALVDADVLYEEMLPEVMQSLQSIFTGYYLQAVAISNTIGKIDVVRHLDRLNPSRNGMNNAMLAGQGWLMATESYKHKLPVPGDEPALEQLALEATNIDQANYDLAVDKYNLDVDTAEIQRQQHDEKMAYSKQKDAMSHINQRDQIDIAMDKTYGSSEQGFGRDTMATMKELTNLSVGKMFTVEISDGLHRASIPVSVRLMASSMPTNSLVHILSAGNQDLTVKERYHAWKSGRLSFVKDLIFCQDLIDAHRKNLMADKEGIYSTILRRSRGNQLSTIVSGNPSVATASNLVVISGDSAAKLELQINGKLRDFRTREKIFKATYMMIMVVIDKQWQRATFYHRGIALATEVGVRDLKVANKGNGPDVSDILKAYQMGNAPSL